MFQSVQSLVERAVMERVTLLLNHVVAAEPIAMQRLQAHAGSSVQLEFARWPSLLPPLPTIAWRVTPAGLLEWLGDERPSSPELRIEVDASNPARAFAEALTGTRPRVEIAGDAAFAGDVNWLIDNLRWDVQDDLARIVGAGPAHEISRVARAIAGGLRDAVRGLRGLVGERGPAAGGSPPR